MDKSIKHRISLVQSNKLENEYYCFDFEKPAGFTFVEGQFCVFELLNNNIEGRNSRVFSIASCSGEDNIRFATRIVDTPSEFKQALLKMQAGEEMLMTTPKGKFVLEKDYDGVFIAGGIGITPIRSMLLSKARNTRKRDDTLIYSELVECYPFKDDLEKLPGLKIIYACDIEPTQKAITDCTKKYQNNVFYYLSGSPGFVKGITGLLKENGITSDYIKFDVFVGY